MIKFSKNSGESIEDAIKILNASNESEGVTAEYQYLSERYGERGTDWKLERQSLLSEKGRSYDKMEIALSDGTKKTIYFDISDFFGKF